MLVPQRYAVQHCLSARMTASGPLRRQTIERYAVLLRGVKGIRARSVSVVHGERESKLYYGSYRVESTGAFPPELDRDIQLIRQLAPANSPTRRPFAAARRIPESTPDVGPSEWDLHNADATYSLQIAVFYNQGEFQKRKLAAVEYCRYWRKKGYQAFYDHGPTRSQTTVGAFGPDAVQYVDGRPHYGKEVLDFIAKEKLFSWNLENNTKRYRIVDGKSTPQKSFLVEKPKNETDELE